MRTNRNFGRPADRRTGGLIATVLFILLLAMPNPAHAQKVAVTSHQFLKVMPSARATAMGDAFTTMASRADALFWNPSGITGVRAHDIATTHTVWLIDTRQTALGYAFQAGRLGHIGVQFQYVDYGEIQETRVDHLGFVDGEYNPGYTGQTFRPHAWVAGVSYARALTDRFSAGVTTKFVSESLWNQRNVTIEGDGGGTFNTYASSVLFDFGMQYDTGFRSVRVGAAVQNFGPQVTFAEDRFPAPMTFRLGIASNLIGSDGLFAVDPSNRLSLAYDIMHPNDYAQQMHMGAEYSFAEVLALRAGYKLNYDVDNWTFGGGLNTRMDRYRLSFDYSYGAMNEFLNNVHRLTLSLAIE
jgi:hypothetical protein